MTHVKGGGWSEVTCMWWRRLDAVNLSEVVVVVVSVSYGASDDGGRVEVEDTWGLCAMTWGMEVPGTCSIGLPEQIPTKTGAGVMT